MKTVASVLGAVFLTLSAKPLLWAVSPGKRPMWQRTEASSEQLWGTENYQPRPAGAEKQMLQPFEPSDECSPADSLTVTRRDPDPQPAYFCTCFEQRHWGTLFQTPLQRFLMWTTLENRRINSLWRRGKVGLPSSLINKQLPQEQRLGGLVAGLLKRLGFLSLEFLAVIQTYSVHVIHPGLLPHGACWIRGRGKPVSPWSPCYLQCCNKVLCIWPRGLKSSASTHETGAGNSLLARRVKSQKGLGSQ